MGYLSRIGPVWLLMTLAILASMWLALSVILIATQGNPEALLTASFGRLTRPGAFEYVNRVSVPLWWVHTCLTLIAILAARWNRTDVVAVLLIGPVIALAIALLSQRWEDPNWHDLLGVCTIGWFVSMVVAGCYWILRGRTRPVC